MKVAAERSYIWLFWVLAIVGITADQASKYGIFAWLYSDGQPREEQVVLGVFPLVTKVEHRSSQQREPWATRELKIVPGTFDIIASHTQEKEEGEGVGSALRQVSGEQLPYVNRGALFGWGGGRTDGQDLNILLAAVSFLAAVGIAYWSRRPATRGDRILCAALGLILAGTIGNLYDRLVFDGVRDFLHWYRWFDWPVFNIADCCLVCGAILLLIQAFFSRPDPATKTAPATVAAVPAPEAKA